MSRLDIGEYTRTFEVGGPKAYQVRRGHRYLTALEDGKIEDWPDTCLFFVDERSGYLMIEGGYGTFSYCWPSYARGENTTLHAFLYDLDFDYFMRKASKTPHMVFDFDKTIAMHRAQIIENRRPCWMGKEQARKLWNGLSDIEHCMNEDEFYRQMADDHDLYDYYFDDGAPSICTREHEGIRRWWEWFWKPFREEILRPYYLDMVKRYPIRRSRALVSTHGRFDKVTA